MPEESSVTSTWPGERDRAARGFRPDVVYAHFLVPAGLIAAVSSRAPLVVTAHGQDVANARSNAAVRRATRWVCKRAAAVVAVSGYLRGELEVAVPEARGKTEVVDCGVDLGSFSVAPPPGGPPSYLFVGSLIERKNVVRLAEAFGRLDDPDATLTVVGDGPLRPALEGRRGVRLVGAVTNDEVREHMAAARVVCQPSLVEPFGQAVLEAMARGRSVVATRVGGPAELVPEGAGLLVDPLDVERHRARAGRGSRAAVPQPGGARRGRGPRRTPPGGADRGDPRAGRRLAGRLSWLVRLCRWGFRCLLLAPSRRRSTRASR